MTLTNDTAEKYITGYFQKKYPISKSVQPHFWDAVKTLAVNPDADVSHLIDDEEIFCVPAGKRSLNSIDVYTNTICGVTDFAKQIANQIIESEATYVSPLDFFLVMKRVEALEEAVFNAPATSCR